MSSSPSHSLPPHAAAPSTSASPAPERNPLAAGWLRWVGAAVLVAAVAGLRWLPLPFSPMGAFAIFAGAVITDRRWAIGVLLGAMLVSDLGIELHPLIPVVYGSLVLSVLLGRWLAGRASVLGVAAASVLGSVQFYLITNFAVWLVGESHGYAPTWAGLMECYAAALPFLQKPLVGDLIFCGLFFGGWAVARAAWPALAEPLTERPQLQAVPSPAVTLEKR